MNQLLSLVLVLFSFCSLAQEYKAISNPADCKKKLENKSKTTKTISANFKETVYSSMFNDPKSGSGLLKYKKEGKIRWEKTFPESNIILINGSSIKMKQNGKIVNNASSNKIAKKMQSMMIKLISHEFLSERDFSIQYYESKLKYKLVLKPKNKQLSKYISSLNLIFTKSTLELDQITMYESEDDYVRYMFSSMLFNASISESTFTKF